MKRSTTYQTGDKAVTLQDIADRLGLSRSTISLAMRRDCRIKPETTSRIHAMAKEMGYDPSLGHAARSLAHAKTGQRVLSRVIAYLMPPEFIHRPYYLAITDSIFDVLMNEQYAVVTQYVDYPHYSLPDIFLRGDIDGAIMCAEEDQSIILLKHLRHHPNFRTKPVISLIETIEGCSNVVADDFHGGYQAASHLIELGHRQILSFGLASNLHSRRWDGQQQAFRDHNLDPAKHIQRIAQLFCFETYAPELRALLKKNPQVTALLLPNDFMAEWFLEQIYSFGIRIPEDISVVGFDDVHDYKKRIEPYLTTVHLPLAEVGREAAQMMLRQIASGKTDPEIIELPTYLVARSTTAPPAKKSRLASL